MRRVHKPVLTILVPLLALGMLIFAITSVMPRPQTPLPSPVTPPHSDYAARVAGIGIVEPESENIALGANISGIVTTIPVTVGDYVKKGAVLFTQDTREASADLAIAQAEKQSAEVALKDARYQLSLFEAVEDKRAISDDELNQKRFAAERAAALVKSAHARIQSIQTTLERLRVTAPMDATVLRINIRPGEFANAGANSQPLMILGNTQTLHVRVEIDETNALHVSKNAAAKGSLRGYPQKDIALRFVRKEPTVLPKRSLTGDGNERVDSRVQEIIYAFDNPDAFAVVGQQMDVFIDIEKKEAP